jgi:hypothetical protein
MRNASIYRVLPVILVLSLIFPMSGVLSYVAQAATLPDVHTMSSVTDITTSSATIWGWIANDGGSSIVERRFDWGTSTPLTQVIWNNSITVSGSFFWVTLTGLSPSTTYYFRAWAKNSAGWDYGSILSFTTTQTADTNKPTITSLSVSPTTTTLGNSFTISFSVSDSGGSGLKQVELWRANDSGGSPGTWAQVTSRAVSGNSYSGSFSNTPSSAGSYWYGIHAVDNADNWNAEPTPVKVTVTTPDTNKPTITSPLQITPHKEKYYVSDLLTANFTIKNVGGGPIILDKLLVGGRFNDGKLPNGEYPDFSSQSLTLNPDQSYQYEGTLQLCEPGSYHFFCTYQTADGKWNTSVDLGPGLDDGDRVKEITVESPSGPYISRIAPNFGVAGEIVTINGMNLCKLPLNATEQLWEESCEVVFDWTLPRDAEILSVNIESCPQEIVVKVPTLDLRLSRDKSIEVYSMYGSFLSSYQTSNEVQFTYMEPVLEGIDPPRTRPGRSVRLTGDYFGNGESGSPYCVNFGAECFDASTENVLWSNNQIDMEVPPVSLILGGTKEAQVVKAILALKSIAESVGWGIVKEAAQEVVGQVMSPDFVQSMPVSDDEGVWLNWFRALVAELLPGFDITLAGDLTVKVTVNTPVGESAPLSFTFTKDWLPIGGELYWTAPSSNIILQGQSPAEFRIYDSQGRVTGLVEGMLKEEIPNSLCTGKTVFIFNAEDSYRYEVVGIDEGTYGLNIFSIGEERVDTFSLTGTSISAEAVHQYTIDWSAFSQGDEEVIVQVDSDGDGEYEELKTLIPPIASFTYSPSNISVNEEIDFDASQCSEVDGEIVSYQWNFGDGNTLAGKTATHAYSAPDDYTVSLVVVDNDGVVSSHSRTIQVADVPDIPIWLWMIIIAGAVCLIAIVVRGIYRRVKS